MRSSHLDQQWHYVTSERIPCVFGVVMCSVWRTYISAGSELSLQELPLLCFVLVNRVLPSLPYPFSTEFIAVTGACFYLLPCGALTAGFPGFLPAMENWSPYNTSCLPILLGNLLNVLRHPTATLWLSFYFFYLRNRKHFACFYRVKETRSEVWENKKCSGNTSRRRVFPQLFRLSSPKLSQVFL